MLRRQSGEVEEGDRLEADEAVEEAAVEGHEDVREVCHQWHVHGRTRGWPGDELKCIGTLR